MSFYLLVKTLHVVCIVIWVSGMMRLSHFWSRSRKRLQAEELEELMCFDRHFTSPAMAFAFLAGLYMAQQAHWWSHPWFLAKFVLAVLFAGLHGLLIGRTKKASTGLSNEVSQPSPWPLVSVLVFLGGIVFLVIVKPA